MRNHRDRVMAGRRAVLAAPLLLPGLARAQSYPDRPVRIVVPFAPGGATDLAARILQPHLQDALGQPIVIENRTGAAGNVGMEAAARAAPDGYTLYLGNVGTLAVNPSVFGRTLKVRPTEDFAAVSLVSDTPDVLVAHPSAPFNSVAELVAYAKAHPGSVDYGSPGAGSLNRLEMELLREQAGGLEMVHIPYPGGAGPAVTAAVAGDVHCLFVTLSSAVGQVQAGRLKALAVTTARRAAMLPAVPTMAESGYADFIASSWQGMLLPAGAPATIVARWHAVLAQVLQLPEVTRRFAQAATEPVASASPARSPASSPASRRAGAPWRSAPAPPRNSRKACGGPRFCYRSPPGAPVMSRKTRQPPPRRPPGAKTGGGTPADRLVRAWLDQDDEAFAEQAEGCIAGGRDGVLSAALRKLAERYEEDAVEDFALALGEIAEVAEAGPGFDMAELVLLPILPAGTLPDPAPLATGLAACGAFPAEAEVVFPAGWRSAEAIGALSPVALRRVLLEVAAGRPPADLPPLGATTLEEGASRCSSAPSSSAPRRRPRTRMPTSRRWMRWPRPRRRPASRRSRTGARR
ncbi:Bug family tripartite tricarboxylate transporter substrate binding protein [Dankookia sp. P2]|uniref:Bug family tripartite tricarboxylate transporter substrate binding protein n=1 Tax=Dankookia sp. P2 TaxID=3423955 RepID=UPI003D67A00E